MYEELRKQLVDVCYLQEVRWRGKGARFFGVKGRRYKLWWRGIDDKTGGVGILVKELSKNVVEGPFHYISGQGVTHVLKIHLFIFIQEAIS